MALEVLHVVDVVVEGRSIRLAVLLDRFAGLGKRRVVDLHLAGSLSEAFRRGADIVQDQPRVILEAHITVDQVLMVTGEGRMAGLVQRKDVLVQGQVVQRLREPALLQVLFRYPLGNAQGDKQTATVLANGPDGVPAVPGAEEIDLGALGIGLDDLLATLSTKKGRKRLCFLLQARLAVHGQVDHKIHTASHLLSLLNRTGKLSNSTAVILSWAGNNDGPGTAEVGVGELKVQHLAGDV